MIRTLLEFFAERSIDNGNEPPRWLRWLVQRDQRLREHNHRARELDSLLRSSALARHKEIVEKTLATPIARPISVERVNQYSTKPAARWAWLAATAAAIIGVAAFANHYTNQQTNAARAQFVSTKLAEVPDEMLAVLAHAARSSQDYSPLTQFALPEGNPWSDIPRGTQGQLKQSLSTWGSQLSDLGERVYSRFDLRSDAEMN